MDALLEVDDLRKHFPVTKGILFSRVKGWVKAVDGVNLSIREGETFGLLGESGCGKTTTAKAILLLEKPTTGSILFQGENILDWRDSRLKDYRASVQAVFQDPFSSLNPRMKVKSIIAEPLDVNNHPSDGAREERVRELLSHVGLDSNTASDLYPHEFSGGQRQRIAIARSLAVDPSLIILDEPVSALDVSIRAQIMNLLKDLQERLGIAYLLIAHSLATVKYMSHWISVMYLGKIVEHASARELYEHPIHPYTQALFSAALPSHPSLRRDRILLPGEVPSPLNLPPGCRFGPRCSSARSRCRDDEPALRKVGPEHVVACHFI